MMKPAKGAGGGGGGSGWSPSFYNPGYNHVMYLYTTILDINECATLNGNCSQTCTNTIGSYYCSCSTGYILGGNNMTCNGELNFDNGDMFD